MHDDGPPPPLYLNRELSWLAFNARVLHEAADPRVPLLERLKFLAIFGSNLDEFFMVRVAGLRRQIASGTLHHTPDGLTAADQLAAIRARVALLLEDQRRCLGALLAELAPHGVRLVGMDALTAGERRAIDEQFESQIFPVLTPLAVDPGHPFPYVSNLSLSLAVEIRDPAEGSVHFARVKVPERLSRWVAVPGRTHEFVPLEQVIGENLEALFSGMDVLGWYAFRVTRYSDLEFTNLDDPDDLLASIEERVFERRFGEVIRLEVQDDMPAHVRALTEAAQRGKQVAVLVELRARFDEANNITWARTLEDYGVHVAYGSALLKTHTKTAMVVRREPDGIRRYIHIGSGNYNSRTARLYTDVGLFTCSPSIGADVSDLFNSLTGISRQRLYRKLLVAPANMRERFIELIRRESAHATAGRGGRIVAKMNALVDAETIDALYAASEAGVEIDLIVRGICCLRPGLPGVSSRIRVISVIGRFLEHSRVWQFGNAGDDELYIGSADWMPRNFVRRVEAVAPVEAPRLRDRLCRLLQTYLDDNRQAWELDADGRYAQRMPGDDVRASQLRLLADSWGEHEGTHGRSDGLTV